MATQEERDAKFDRLWNELDTDGSGALEYEEFKRFLCAYEETELPEDQCQFYFKGTDIDCGGTVGKDEMKQLVKALFTNDKLYINKLFFRAIDEDCSGKLEADEFVQLAKLNGIDMTIEKAQKNISKISGGKDYITFAQMFKKLTKQEIPADTDPYDGKRPKRASNIGKDVEKDKDRVEEAQEKKEESSSSSDKKKEEPNKEEPKKEQPKKESKPATSAPATGMAKIFGFVMMGVYGLCAAALIICAAALIQNYIKLTDFLPQVVLDTIKIKMVKFDDAFNPLNGDATINTMWYALAIYLAPGIMFIFFAIVEILAIVGIFLEAKLPIISKLVAGDAIRGIVYILAAIPTLGALNTLGISGGIILAIAGFALLVCGIIKLFVVKPAKAI